MCCEDVGCFSDEPPYDHYRLPWCPEQIPTSHTLYSREGAHGGEDFGVNSIP